MSNPPKKLLEKVKDRIWLKYYSSRTEETDIQSIRRYILFHNHAPLKDRDRFSLCGRRPREQHERLGQFRHHRHVVPLTVHAAARSPSGQVLHKPRQRRDQ
jgi:hypothetical protein